MDIAIRWRPKMWTYPWPLKFIEINVPKNEAIFGLEKKHLPSQKKMLGGFVRNMQNPAFLLLDERVSG